MNLLAAKAELALGKRPEEHSFVDLMHAISIAGRIRNGEYVDIDYETRRCRYKWQRDWIERKVREYSNYL
jgi:hypothetical protein